MPQTRSLFRFSVCLLLINSALSHQGEHNAHGKVEDGHPGPLTEHSFHHASKDDASHQKEHVSQMFGREGRKHWEKEVKEQTGMDTNLAKASDAEIMVHFFKLHDFDKNQKLDGLELISALSSYFDYGLVEPGTEEAKNMATSPLLLQEEVESIVDRTLEENDVDGDGYVTFVELMANRDGLWGTLDLVDDLDGEEENDYEEGEVQEERPTENAAEQS